MFSVEFTVRDYECDLQGVVNNANYLHYMEHARHQFLLHHGIDFAQLAASGVDLMLTRVEVDFKRPLRPGDRFAVTVALHPVSRLKVCFAQQVIRSDGQLMVSARNIGVALKQGRPFRFEPLQALLSSADERVAAEVRPQA